MVKQGPGTIWETWNDKSNSHNHPMFTASIGPYLYSIAGLDPSTWTVPSYLASQASASRQGDGGAAHQEVTMHVTPDPHAVRVLGQASGTVATMCGMVAVEWRAVPGPGTPHFAMAATVPHNCGRARLVMHVPEALAASDALCVGTDLAGTGGYLVGGHGAEPGARGGLPRNVFDARLAADNKTVDVVVGGGRVDLKLGRCL